MAVERCPFCGRDVVYSFVRADGKIKCPWCGLKGVLVISWGEQPPKKAYRRKRINRPGNKTTMKKETGNE